MSVHSTLPKNQTLKKDVKPQPKVSTDGIKCKGLKSTQLAIGKFLLDKTVNASDK